MTTIDKEIELLKSLITELCDGVVYDIIKTSNNVSVLVSINSNSYFWYKDKYNLPNRILHRTNYPNRNQLTIYLL